MHHLHQPGLLTQGRLGLCSNCGGCQILTCGSAKIRPDFPVSTWPVLVSLCPLQLQMSVLGCQKGEQVLKLMGILSCFSADPNYTDWLPELLLPFSMFSLSTKYFYSNFCISIPWVCFSSLKGNVLKCGGIVTINFVWQQQRGKLAESKTWPYRTHRWI